MLNKWLDFRHLFNKRTDKWLKGNDFQPEILHTRFFYFFGVVLRARKSNVTVTVSGSYKDDTNVSGVVLWNENVVDADKISKLDEISK